MTRTSPLRKLTRGLRAVPLWDYKTAVYIATLTATISGLRVTYNLAYNYSVFKSLDGNHLTCCVNFLESFLILITAGFVVTTVGLWLRRIIGFFLSLLALLWIGGIYTLWHLSTLSLMHEYQVQNFSQLQGEGQHLLALFAATWWDLVALAVTVILFTWQIKILFTIKRNAH